MEVEVFLRELLNNRDYRGQAAGVRCLPARDAFYSQPQRPLAPELAAALTEMGIRQLYSHQAKAVDLIREGHNVVIVTSTASGKTLC